MSYSEEGPTFEMAVIFTGVSTDDAFQIRDPASGDDIPIWIPFSQTLERHGKLSGGSGTILITEWIAKKKGFL